MEELEVAGIQLPVREHPTLLLRSREGNRGFAIGLSPHQVQAMQLAACACARCGDQEPALLTVVAALGGRVLAVAIHLQERQTPGTWLLTERVEPMAPEPVERSAQGPTRVPGADLVDRVAGARVGAGADSHRLGRRARARGAVARAARARGDRPHRGRLHPLARPAQRAARARAGTAQRTAGRGPARLSRGAGFTRHTACSSSA
jgi:hypothetical protein